MLLAREAERLGQPLAILLEEEVAKRISAPSEEELQTFYEANQGLIGAKFEEVAPVLKEKLQERQEQH